MSTYSSTGGALTGDLSGSFSALDPNDSNLNALSDGSPTSSDVFSAYQAGVQGGGGGVAYGNAPIAPTLLNEIAAGIGELNSGTGATGVAKFGEDLAGINTQSTSIGPAASNLPIQTAPTGLPSGSSWPWILIIGGVGLLLALHFAND